MASGDELAPFVLTNVEGLHDSSQEREKGSGAYGVVYKVSVNGMPCIAKRLHAILTREVSRQEKDSVQAKFRNECIMLSKLQHPNIVHFVGVCYGKSVEELSLIMECLYTDLDKYLETQPNIPLPDKLSILLDVSYGLLYLHTSNPPIIHRDLTAPNILLTKGLRAKIADLGVSKLLSTRRVAAHTQTKGPGQILYMPPEALKENPKYDSKLDVFSFGHLAIYVSSQEFPKVYGVTITASVLQEGTLEILKRRKSIDAVGQDHCLYPLIRQCLMDDPERRPSTSELNKALVALDIKSSETELSHCQQLQRARAEVAGLKEVLSTKAKQVWDSAKSDELNQLRKSELRLQQDLQAAKLENATYREDFEAERQEREEKASVVDSLKANLSLQHQYLDEYQKKLEANVSEKLYEEIQALELKRKEEAEQSEARLKEKEGTHEEEMKLATAKEIRFKDEIQNLTTKNEQLQNQCQQKLKEIERLITKHQQLQSLSQQKSQELNGLIAQLENELAGGRADITVLEEELAGKTQQVKHYFKQVEDQKREIAALHSQGEEQKRQYDTLWGEADNSKQRVTNLRGQLQKRLEEIEQLHQEIKRLHQDHQDLLDYMTAQQKSDMLNAKSDKRDIMREKEQLKLELEHLKKWMQQAGFSVDPATGALPVPRKPHPPATDSVAMLPSRANQGSGPGRQQQYPPNYPPTTGSAVNERYAQGYYPAQPSNAGGPSAIVGAQQGPPMQDRTQDRTHVGTNQPRGGNGLQSDSAGQDSLKNLLEAGITTDIHNVAAEFGEEYETSSLPDVPLDPNLVCPMCGLQLRIGEIQKYKRHVQQCKGSSGLN